MPRWPSRALEEVFYAIDMKGGDTKQCWPWRKQIDNSPIFCYMNRRYRAHRVVYALKHGIPLDAVPQLAWLCANRECCNPHHLVERYGVGEKLKRRIKCTM